MSSAVKIAYSPFAERNTLADSIVALRSGVSGHPADFRDRVTAMDGLAKQILEPASPLRQQLPSDGLAYLATFLQRSYMERLISREIKDIRSLSEFVSVEPRKSVRTLARGLVCHWVAGNVPLLALFSWALSVVLGNRNLIRLSTRQNDVVSPILQELKRSSTAGATIANESVVVWFDSLNMEAHQLMSEAADVRIAWGGKEAVDSIRNLPTNWDCENVTFGPRMSLGVVDPEAIDNGGIRRLATDVVVFDQLACSSPQFIFVKGERSSKGFRAFADQFRLAFETQSKTYPRHPLDFSESYQIRLDQARVLLDGGEVYGDEFTNWTVAIVDQPHSGIQCANRFVQLVPYKTFGEIYPHIPANVQTVVTKLDAADLADFTEQAAHYGVCRFPRPGEGNNFENPWDGIGLVSRLTRAVTRTDGG